MRKLEISTSAELTPSKLVSNYCVKLRDPATGQYLNLPCRDRSSARDLAARLAGSIEASACIDVELI